MEGAWQGAELERPAGGLGAALCPAAQEGTTQTSGLASGHLPGLRRGLGSTGASGGTAVPRGFWVPRADSPAPTRGSLQAPRTKPPAPGPVSCFWAPLYPLLRGQRLRQEAEEKQQVRDGEEQGQPGRCPHRQGGAQHGAQREAQREGHPEDCLGSRPPEPGGRPRPWHPCTLVPWRERSPCLGCGRAGSPGRPPWPWRG